MSSELIEFSKFTKARSLQALKISVPICIILGFIFVNFTQLDLISSHWFYDEKLIIPAKNNSGFWLGESAFLGFIYKAVNVISRLALFISIFTFIWFMLKKNARAFYAAIVMLSLLSGPVIAVNGVAKEQWGRARPRTIQEFNGKQQFTPAWIMTDQCKHNCSFTSGHAAAGFALCVGFFVSRRKIWLNSGLLLGGLVGLTRMMNGAHFLSDVIFSFFIVYIMSAITAYFISTLVLNYGGTRASQAR
jgi:lipid A 4'-phosphatase